MANRIDYKGSDKLKKKLSEILNEGGGGVEVDPTVPDWAKDTDGPVPISLVEINAMFADW